VNMDGSYFCTCNTGYISSGNRCTGKLSFIHISLVEFIGLSLYELSIRLHVVKRL